MLAASGNFESYVAGRPVKKLTPSDVAGFAVDPFPRGGYMLAS